MHAEWRIVAILSILGWTEADDLEAQNCEFNTTYSRNQNLNTNDCSIEWSTDGSRHLLNCMVHLSVESPPLPNLGEGGDDLDPDSPRTLANQLIPMDYRLKFLLFEPGTSTVGNESNFNCMKVMSVRYERLSSSDEIQRYNFSLSSGIFNVIRNTEMMFSDTDLHVPLLVGSVEIDPACKYWKKGSSTCIRRILIKFTNPVPGTLEDVNIGLVDFSITSFGYSHISGLLQEYSQFIFNDKTRKGKILLKHLPGENITDLRVPNNRWTSINDSEIPLLPKLQYLDLSLNDFQEFNSRVIGVNGQLRELNFSESNLLEIPAFIANQPNLTLLNIGGNKFQKSENEEVTDKLKTIVANLNKLEKLNISGIRMRYIDKTTLPKLDILKNLDVSNCKTVAIEDGAFDVLPSIEWIDLSKNLLNDVPKNLFSNLKNLTYVDLSRNKIREGQGLVFFTSISLRVLNMSGNALVSVDNLIAYPDSAGLSIKCIDLSNNALQDLNQFSVYKKYGINVSELNLASNYIRVITKDIADGLEYVELIYLTDNQFDCGSCDMPDFKLWLHEESLKKLKLPPESFVCESPSAARINQTLVVDSWYHETPCKPPDYELYVGGSFSGIVLLASLVGGILYLYRFEVSYILHILRVRRRVAKGEVKPHSECFYDAFVSYSGRDRNWVLRVLQPGLEDSDQKYQLCLHDRNFSLGGIITQNIVDSIDKSRKTILILSESFVDSQWCRWEMEMANHKLIKDSRNFLVLIELERLDRSLLPRHLRFLMDTRTYLEWPTASSTILNLPETQAPEDGSASFPSITVESSSSKQHGEVSEQAYAIFWRRLQEALGDSLYVKEEKAKREAEKAIKKTKEREVDIADETVKFYTHREEQLEETVKL